MTRIPRIRLIRKEICEGLVLLPKILYPIPQGPRRQSDWCCLTQRKLDGSAQRVPVLTGSLTELTTVLGKKVTAEEVNSAMKTAGNESSGYTEDEIVSSDVIGMTYGSLFDATQTKVLAVGDTQLVKTVSWYDNEMSYVSQLVRTVHYFAKLISK